MSEPSDTPPRSSPHGPVLMSAANRHGWKLEELLPALREELRAKCAAIESDASPTARAVRTNNEVIIGLLGEAEAFQRNTLERLAAIGPDLGPGHPPRIGAGAPVRVGQDSSGS